MNTGIRRRLKSISHKRSSKSESCKLYEIDEYSPIAELLHIWENNVHRGGQKLVNINIPNHVLSNNSKLWESPEIVEQLQKIFKK